mmetsp:Transcript_24536/g.61533  ORF Transcript_24536/g.61533 Transcript_24536/m.61533 type:complete len:468 (+) Transcript_24536:2-1405(+)
MLLGDTRSSSGSSCSWLGCSWLESLSGGQSTSGSGRLADEQLRCTFGDLLPVEEVQMTGVGTTRHTAGAGAERRLGRDRGGVGRLRLPDQHWRTVGGQRHDVGDAIHRIKVRVRLQDGEGLAQNADGVELGDALPVLGDLELMRDVGEDLLCGAFCVETHVVKDGRLGMGAEHPVHEALLLLVGHLFDTRDPVHLVGVHLMNTFKQTKKTNSVARRVTERIEETVQVSSDLEQVEFIAVCVLVGQLHHDAQVGEARVALQLGERGHQTNARVCNEVTTLELTQMSIVVEAIAQVRVAVGQGLMLIGEEKAHLHTSVFRNLVFGFGRLQVQFSFVHFFRSESKRFLDENGTSQKGILEATLGPHLDADGWVFLADIEHKELVPCSGTVSTLLQHTALRHRAVLLRDHLHVEILGLGRFAVAQIGHQTGGLANVHHQLLPCLLPHIRRIVARCFLGQRHLLKNLCTAFV